MKTAAQAMQYEEMAIKKSKNVGRKTLVMSAEKLDSFSLVWLLVKRHKVGLLAIGNIILVLNWIMPAWPELVKSII